MRESDTDLSMAGAIGPSPLESTPTPPGPPPPHFRLMDGLEDPALSRPCLLFFKARLIIARQLLQKGFNSLLLDPQLVIVYSGLFKAARAFSVTVL